MTFPRFRNLGVGLAGHGPLKTVHRVIEDEQVRMFIDGTKPKAALESAARGSCEPIQDYNYRVGG